VRAMRAWASAQGRCHAAQTWVLGQDRSRRETRVPPRCAVLQRASDAVEARHVALA